MSKLQDELQVIFDPATRVVVIILGERSATLPFPVYNQREAAIMGRDYARSLCWFEKAMR